MQDQSVPDLVHYVMLVCTAEISASVVTSPSLSYGRMHETGCQRIPSAWHSRDARVGSESSIHNMESIFLRCSQGISFLLFQTV